MGQPDLKYSIYVNAEPEQIWRIYTDAEATRAIFFGSELRSTFEVGASYEYVGPGTDGEETVHVYGQVLAYEPYRFLSFTEHAGPSYREDHANWKTRVSMTLEKVGQTTKVTIVNDEWPDEHPSYASTQESWLMILSNIKTYVETGKTMDFGW
ncbi:SRPBCC domain-containing protein [Cohnella sp. REN36]|uniref:SRPBCC domain-containing protein n=1 Tax=Cohnella sp. REN36 TaxID=2887347 RepID=UPI001D1519C6|nr:SRPBCC domain-containing protein [Cohnella sp. REN36]MCC3375026.1 SRPBCC domain-containing protein [Cohnella sp. REN36]